jgi:CrcB protein
MPESDLGERSDTDPNGLPVDPDVTPEDLTSDDTPADHTSADGGTAPASETGGTSARLSVGVGAKRAPVRRRGRGRARVEYVRRRTRRVLTSRGDVLAVIAAGGAVGSLARWGLAQALPHPGDAFPWATFDANVTGCFALGVLMVFVSEVWPPSRYVRPFLGVGVLGGYTTFSTYMLDTRALLLSGRGDLAGIYVVASLVAGLTAVWVGIVGVRTLVVLARHRAERRRWGPSDGEPASTRSRRPVTSPTGHRPDPSGPNPSMNSHSPTNSPSTTRSPR